VLARKLSGGWQWLCALGRGETAPSPWRQGPNLLLALVIALLLALALLVSLSGWAAYNDWGDDAFEELHEFFGNAMLAVVLTHVGLIVLLSLLRRKNLALPMLTDRANGPGAGLVTRNRAWLAALMLLVALAFGGWMWQ
jgi:cytochrome b561